MNKEDYLKTLLENISDTYSDFVQVTLISAVRNNVVDDIIEYINQNSNVNTSDVLIRMNELEGIFPIK